MKDEFFKIRNKRKRDTRLKSDDNMFKDVGNMLIGAATIVVGAHVIKSIFDEI